MTQIIEIEIIKVGSFEHAITNVSLNGIHVKEQQGTDWIQSAIAKMYEKIKYEDNLAFQKYLRESKVRLNKDNENIRNNI